MFDFVAQEIPEVPQNTIVYMVNNEITKTVPVEQLPENERGFLVRVRDAEGKYTMQYVKTAIIRTIYIDKDKNRNVPLENAVRVVEEYCDEKGNVLYRPMVILTREKK